jgi:hypothetical protein
MMDDDDHDDDVCEAIVQMRTGRENRSILENLPQCHFAHHKSHLNYGTISVLLKMAS